MDLYRIFKELQIQNRNGRAAVLRYFRKLVKRGQLYELRRGKWFIISAVRRYEDFKWGVEKDVELFVECFFQDFEFTLTKESFQFETCPVCKAKESFELRIPSIKNDQFHGYCSSCLAYNNPIYFAEHALEHEVMGAFLAWRDTVFARYRDETIYTPKEIAEFDKRRDTIKQERNRFHYDLCYKSFRCFEKFYLPYYTKFQPVDILDIYDMLDITEEAEQTVIMQYFRRLVKNGILYEIKDTQHFIESEVIRYEEDWRTTIEYNLIAFVEYFFGSYTTDPSDERIFLVTCPTCNEKNTLTFNPNSKESDHLQGRCSSCFSTGNPIYFIEQLYREHTRLKLSAWRDELIREQPFTQKMKTLYKLQDLKDSH